MKEAYFTSKNLDAMARQMLAEIHFLKDRHRHQVFSPARAALLVLDMQSYFLSPDSHAFVPSAEAIILNLQKLIKIFANHQRPTIFTRHINTPEDAGAMGRWWRDLISPYSAYSQIDERLFPELGITLAKNRYDAFYQTTLEEDLRRQGVEQVVITGVMTHLCCETTARSAFIRDFEVFFCVDGTATYNQDFHRATLLNLAHGFALPVLCSEIESAFGAD